MSAQQSPDFEVDPNDKTRLICRICSNQSDTQDFTFKRTSKPSHLKSKQHQQALIAAGHNSCHPTANSSTTSQVVAVDKLSSVPTASHLDRILDELSDIEEDSPAPAPNPLDDVQMDDTSGLYIDNFGTPVHFSAGESHLKNQDIKMKQALEHLRLLRTHTLLGKFDDGSILGPEPNDLAEDASDSVVSQITAAIDSLAMEEEDELDEDIYGNSDAFPPQSDSMSSDWLPHTSKTIFMLDLLDNLPRLRLSDDHLKAIIWVMRECGTPNVPSFSQLRKIQRQLTQAFNIGPQHHISALDNHFFMNHPSKLFAMDWANPLVRKHLHIYPEVSDTISETYHAAKWLEEVGFDELSPMWADWNSPSTNHRHFYVYELTQTDNGLYVVPLRWISVKGTVYADALRAESDLSTAPGTKLHITIHSNQELCRIPAKSLKYNFLDIQAQFVGGIVFAEFTPTTRITSINPLREKARGRPMFRLRVIPWSDDVSGNVSKQYNAHTNIYITNANLPHQKLSQEYFVRYCSTSAIASSSEQFIALAQDFHQDHWQEAYDCELRQEILFQIIPHFLPADNPQQSETSSHIGVNANLNCRRDLTGGSEAEKETEKGYEALYHPGTARTTDQTIQCIRYQLWLACQGNQTALAETRTVSGVKDKISQYWIDVLLAKFKVLQESRLKNRSTRDPELNRTLEAETRKALVGSITRNIQKELWEWLVQQPKASYDKLAESDPARHDIRAGDHFNVLLCTRGIDPHKDTPGEMLHTYLLGNDKYVWHGTSKAWNDRNEATFAARLHSSCLHGFSIAPPRAEYIVKYKNSLIGKHFKALQQLAIFHIHDLCAPEMFRLWKVTGELGAFLWIPKIQDMEVYLKDLQILIDNLLDAWASVDPRRIITKIKLHVLTHLPEDIRRFGPAVIFTTEVFECFNAVFRMCSVLSNHLSPSCDITTCLADMERFKHMVSGGWWKNSDNIYVQAGSQVQSFLKRNLELQRRLGWADEDQIPAGFVKLAPLPRTHGKRRQPSKWLECIADLKSTTQLLPPDDDFHSLHWNNCSLVVSRSRNLCRLGSWVFFKQSSNTLNTAPGRILKILTKSKLNETASNSAVILVEHFDIASERDKLFNMPVLHKSGVIAVATPKDILFDFNAQHSCVNGKCKIGESTASVVQERIATNRLQQRILHTNDEEFLVNTHALHNAHLIREVLPRELIAPVSIQPSRVEFHRKLTSSLQISGSEKRAETRAKAQATRQRTLEQRGKGAVVVGKTVN